MLLAAPAACHLLLPPPACHAHRADFQECQVHRHYYLAVTHEPDSYIAQ